MKDNQLENKPLVSIITATLNSAKYLRENFEAVSAQTYGNWEWLLIDGGSNDGTIELIQEFMEKDHRIKLFHQTEKTGTGGARNIGLDNASGEYISLLDSDDKHDATFLEEQMDFIKDHGSFVCASYRRLKDGETTDYIVPEKMTYKSICKGNPINPLTVIYRKADFPDIRFVNLWREDLDFFLELLKVCKVCYGNTKVLATYRLHEGQKSTNRFNLIREQFKVYRHQKINWFKSCYYLLCWSLYGFRKYRKILFKRRKEN